MLIMFFFPIPYDIFHCLLYPPSCMQWNSVVIVIIHVWLFSQEMWQTSIFFFTCPTSACICLFSSPFSICFVFPQSVCPNHSFVFLWLVVRFYVLTGILMTVYDSRNTVATITPVSVVVFLLSERSELINVMCNMFSGKGSPSPMPLCCNSSCQFALYLLMW
jgi:hypothetical protein